MKNKTNAPVKPTNNNNNYKKGTNSKNINGRNYITAPYMKGLSESIKNTCKKYGIQVYFKGGKTIKDLLVAPKDKEHITKKSGIICRYKCDRLECDEENIGESVRTFGERFREHLKASSPIYNHCNITGHTTTLENFSIGEGDQNLIRLIKESIYIRVNNPSLNRNIGKYHLPHIWDEVLLNNTELKLKYVTQWPFHLPQRQQDLPYQHSILCGYSICHNGNNICHHIIQAAFHLPHLQKCLSNIPFKM